MKTRALVPADLDALAAIIDAIPFFVGYPVAGASVARSLEETSDLVRVAVDDHDVILGFAWLMARGAFGRSAYLRLLAVDPDAQGLGVGRALMRDLESRTQGRGLMLLVTADNAPARRFYERLGYDHVGTLPSYVRPGRDECIYFKP